MFFWNVFNPKSKLTTLEELNIQVKIKKIKQNKSNREQNPLEPFNSDAAHNEREERGQGSWWYLQPFSLATASSVF